MYLLWFAGFGPLGAKKIHSFHEWRGLSGGRRCQSPERSGAGTGAEASTARFWFMRQGELHKRD
jgi:hypothetical protein